MRVKVGLCVFGAALAGATVLSSPAGADTVMATKAWASAFAAVPSASGKALISGSVIAQGKPSSEATVVLFAHADGGKDINPIAVARTSSDAAGRWSIAVPATVDVEKFADSRSQTVNFEVRSFDRTGSSTYFFSAQAAKTLAIAQAKQPTLVDGGVARLSGSTVTLAADPSQVKSVVLHPEQSPTVKAAGAAPKSGGGSPPVCATTVLATYQHVKTLLAYTADEALNTAEHFVYSAGATSNLGVGVQAANGAFTASGTWSISTAVGANFPAPHDISFVNYYGTTDYQKVRTACSASPGFSSSAVTVRPTGLTGGFSYSAAPRMAMGQCEGVQKGITTHKNKTAAYQASAGVSISGYIGINLSSQTGYSTTADIDYAFNGDGHPWCGLSAPPAAGTSKLQTIHASVWNG